MLLLLLLVKVKTIFLKSSLKPKYNIKLLSSNQHRCATNMLITPLKPAQLYIVFFYFKNSY